MSSENRIILLTILHKIGFSVLAGNDKTRKKLRRKNEAFFMRTNRLQIAQKNNLANSFVDTLERKMHFPKTR